MSETGIYCVYVLMTWHACVYNKHENIVTKEHQDSTLRYISLSLTA